MGMGLFRWLLSPLWRRDRDWEPKHHARGTRRGGHRGAYQVEVDGEAERLHGERMPFSFWSSARIILILSLLLWWLQPAGPMIAGFVGGRRAGSPLKAIVAALLPVFIIMIVNFAYAQGVAARQIDFVASLPAAGADAVATILPFMLPYKEFLLAYLATFVSALQTVFGMGVNGYIMVILFAYIGGLIAEQTRRELLYKETGGTTVGVNLLQPMVVPYARAEAEAYEDEEAYEPRRSRRPVYAPLATRASRKLWRVATRTYEDFRKVSPEAIEARPHRETRRRSRAEDMAEESRAMRRPAHGPANRTRGHAEALHEEEEVRREPRPTRQRTREEELAIQRFVERALRQYDRAKV